VSQVAQNLSEAPQANGGHSAEGPVSQLEERLEAASAALAELAGQLERAEASRGRVATKGVDEFGFEPAFRARVTPLFRFLYHHYWRVEAIGIRNVPRRGPVLLVANHSGAVPFDAAMISYALEEKRGGRIARFLYDRFVERMPWVPHFYRRVGAVVAGRQNAEILLERGEVVGIFPEGVAGTAKLFSERYVLKPFNSGFVRMSLKFSAPVVPVAVVGAEETYPLIARIPSLGRMIGAPYLPVTPFFPFLGVLGAVPLPTKWYIRFGRPLTFDDLAGRRRLQKPAVQAKANEVRQIIQRMLSDLLAQRRSVF